jgi:hypothetical protein
MYIHIGGVVLLVGVLLSVLWLVSMVAVLTNPDRYRNGSQMIWLLVLLLSGPIGAVLYLCLGPARVEHYESVPDRRARRDAIANPWGP